MRRAVLTSLLFLSACGGGGGGSNEITVAPFWLRSGLVVADLDGDGRDDVAVAVSYIADAPPHPGYVDVYLQTANGTYAAATRYPVGPDPWGLALGDIDGDGHPDLLAAIPSSTAPAVNVASDSGGVSLLRQDRTRAGTFGASTWWATGGAASAALLADLNGDGRSDLLVADSVLANARALLLLQSATAPGNFAAPLTLPVGAGRGSEDVAVADLNGDGRPDIVLAAGNSVVVLYQRAGGGFDDPSVIASGTRIGAVVSADLDGDGRADIVAVDAGNAPEGGSGGAKLIVLLQTQTGNFAAHTIAVADGARRFAIGDLDGDGVPDLAVVSLVYQALSTPSQVSVLRQLASNRGQFAPADVYVGPSSANFIAIGDVNADGRNDIVLNDGPSVLLQRSDTPGRFEPLRSLLP